MPEEKTTPNFINSPSVVLDYAFLAILMGISISGAAYVSSDMDAGRDVFFAWGIAQGNHFPLSGPSLAQSIQAGPIWFYFLAIPLLIFPSWSALTLWAAAFASTKYLFAYLIGREVHGREFGLLWASLLALPGWHFINFLVFTHTLMIETASLACLFCLVKWANTGRGAWLTGGAFSFCLALHAHPSAYTAALVVAPLLVLAPYRKNLSPRLVLVALAGFSLPLLPYFFEQSISRWPDFSGGLAYIDSQPITQSLLEVDDLITGVLYGGWDVGLRSVAGLATDTVLKTVHILNAGIVLTAIGLIRALVKRSTRKIACYALYSLVIVFLGVALIRETTPFYMTYILYPVIAGTAAFGLMSFPLAGKPLALTVMAASAVVLVIAANGARKAGEIGLLSFPKHAGNVRVTPPVEVRSSLYFPVKHQATMGIFICDNHPVVLHGFAATIAELSYGTAAGMACGLSLGDIKSGGPADSPWKHLHGMPLHSAKTLGLKGGVAVGNLIFFAVKPLFPDGERKPLDPNRYPMRDFLPPPNTEVTFSVELPADHILSVSNITHYFMQYKAIVKLNGTEVMPSASDLISRYYAADISRFYDTAHWTVTISAPDPGQVDIASIAQ